MGEADKITPPLPVSKGNLGVKAKRCGGKILCYVTGGKAQNPRMMSGVTQELRIGSRAGDRSRGDDPEAGTKNPKISDF